MCSQWIHWFGQGFLLSLRSGYLEIILSMEAVLKLEDNLGIYHWRLKLHGHRPIFDLLPPIDHRLISSRSKPYGPYGDSGDHRCTHLRSAIQVCGVQ